MCLNGFIYVIRHIGCGLEYVGLTIRRPETRWAQHVAAATAGSRLAIHVAIRESGVASFTFEVIWTGPVGVLVSQEAKFIRERKTQVPFGYNMIPGGRGAPLRTLKTKSMMRLGVEDVANDVLMIPFESSNSRLGIRHGNPCVLSLEETTRLLDWGIWPGCKCHKHIKKSKASPAIFKRLHAQDGTPTKLLVPLTEFYRVIEWGWSISARSNGLG